MNKKVISKRKSFYLPIILILCAAFITLSVALVEVAIMQRKSSKTSQNKIDALGISEAGVSYYLWHLSHNNADYTDGNGAPQGGAPYGPYVHQYIDNTGKNIGSYSLLITPPVNGSTVTTVESTGTLNGSSTTRTVKAVLGIPSFSQYAVVTNNEIWFGDSENTNGPVHSNTGIHYDGTNNGIVSSANASYVPATQFGGDGHTTHNGVWGSGGPTDQWIYPVPRINFQNITADFLSLQTSAASGGKSLGKSTGLGYYIQFLANGTYNLATVTNSTLNQFSTTALVNQPAPANGIIFAADHVWVSGTVHGRYTIAAATLPAAVATYRDITITNNLVYTAKDGTDALGLAAQRDVKVGPLSPNTLEINAAMLAQNGRVYRPICWNDNCGQGIYNIRNAITVYGSIGCFNYWNWTWVNGNNVISGYRTTTQTYDQYLLYAPPPSFPLTGQYALLSWREELNP